MLTRFYTLSDCANGRCYRLTIKKELPPENLPHAPSGLSSTFFHETLRVGDVIEAKMPAGNFTLDMGLNHPVALLAGGIGVTPMISMMNSLCQARSSREVYFVFALRHGGDHAFKEHLRSIDARCPNIHMCVLYEKPRIEDRLGIGYDRVGRADVALLRELLPTLNMEYYICGPRGMMDAISNGLVEAGVPESSIRMESFGGDNSAYRYGGAAADGVEDAEPHAEVSVTFSKSGKTVQWSKPQTLLQLAEENGIEIASGCRYGDCGTCMTPLLEGRVVYMHKTVARPDPGTCLPCSCQPENSIVLEA